MVLSIRTNLSAIASLSELREGVAATQRTFAKVSSGSRISTARDDASGLAISNNLRLDLASATSALTNIAQATSVVQIADSGLQSIQGKLDRMNEIAALAASSTLTDTERSYLDVEFQELKAGITAVTNSTSFNGENLLGERPEFALGPIGADIESVDGIIGFEFDNDGLFADGDVFEFTYDSATGVFQIENTNTSYRETVNNITSIADGKTAALQFDEIGITIRLGSHFDFATDIDPAVDDATFIVRANDPLAPSFSPFALPNMVQNVSVEDGVVNVTGSGVQSVSDLQVTGGNNQLIQNTAANRPQIDYGGVFGRDALDFDGVNDFMAIADSGSINLGSFNQRTVALNFETGADVAATQVLYEEGANVNGLNVYIQGGQLYAGIYRSNGAIGSFVNIGIAANTQYTFSFDFDAGTNNVRAYLNGVEFANQAGIGAAFPSHSGDIGLGGINQQTRLHDLTLLAAGNTFGGKIGDFLLYNDTFTAADHANLDLHLRNLGTPATAGFSNESMAFQVDHANGEQLVYEKPQVDFLITQLSGLNVLNTGSATLALDEIRAASDFISTERSKIGSILSKLEFATNQVSVFKENTVNANSVIRDVDIAQETTNLANKVLRDRVNVLTLQDAVDMGGRLLALLDSGIRR